MQIADSMAANRYSTITAWDGLFPAIAFLSPTVLSVLMPDAPPGAIGVMCLVISFVLAVVRSSMAYGQLEVICGQRPPYFRQVIIAMAIVVLLICEVVTNILQIVRPPKIGPWFIPLLLFGFYMTLVAYALRPMRRANVETFQIEVE